MKPGLLGVILLCVGMGAAFLTVVGYAIALLRPQSRAAIWFGRIAYGLTAFSVLGAFASLLYIVYNRLYMYDYAVAHTGNELHGWYRLAATWSGQEGSFLLWAAWTAVIGFLVFAKAGKYEARVMPIFVTILAFLCAILLKQSPYKLFLAENHGWTIIPPDGMGLTPSLQNYWMTIHPPTIFFGFASLAVPFCYAIAALLWKDYEGWTPRVMPYSLLSCATLGVGLFMGGYWAYETLGWHGFWAWDPVENASFFPWLAITALVHGLVVQKSRGGMGRTNTFLGILAFSLFLVGTFLTRSGALSGKGADGQMLSVHAFDNISKSGLALMVTMLAVYGGGGLLLWFVRVWKIPTRKSVGDSLVSRDFAFFFAVLLMLIACLVVTLGSTSPLILSWLHRPPSQPTSGFYNRVMLPIALLAAFAMGCVPWLAWRKTNPETFLRKLLVPWFLMLAFGFFMVFWAQSAERAMAVIPDQNSIEAAETLHWWINPTVQRLAVVALTAMGLFAALSNAMLAYRVFRAKPLSAGGWLAHVGIGLLIIGTIVSNTYERTEILMLREGDAPKEVFGYKLSFEKMTGKVLPPMPVLPGEKPENQNNEPMPATMSQPDFDLNNAVEIRVAPPGSNGTANADGSPSTFLIKPRWFVHNLYRASEENRERMRWPAITKSLGHDFYVAMANDAIYEWKTDDPERQRPGVVMQPGETRHLGPYTVHYEKSVGEPQKFFAALLKITTEDGQSSREFRATPTKEFVGPQQMADRFNLVKDTTDGTVLKDENGAAAEVYLDSLNPATKAATLRINLPGFSGGWMVPLAVTFKPWVNLVWIGVIIAVLGTLLAMVRRALEARKVTDIMGEPAPVAKVVREVWEIPEDIGPVPAVAGAASGASASPETNGNGHNGNGNGHKTNGSRSGKASGRSSKPQAKA